MPAGEGLARLYAASRLYSSLFQPSFKLQAKRRGGTLGIGLRRPCFRRGFAPFGTDRFAMVVERYHPPAPPADAAVSDADKAGLRAMLAGAYQVLRPSEIRAAQTESGERVNEGGMSAGRSDRHRETIRPEGSEVPPEAGTPKGVPWEHRGAFPRAPIELVCFAASLKAARSKSKRRPTHPRAHIRRKRQVYPSILDAVCKQMAYERIGAWLDKQPSSTAITVTAVAVLERLARSLPSGLSPKALRQQKRRHIGGR